MRQVDLAQVRLGRVLRDPGAVLGGDTAVRIAVDAQGFEQVDGRLRALADAVLRVRSDSDDSDGREVEPEAQQAQARRTPIASISLR